MDVEFNKITRAIALDQVSYLSGLISDDAVLEDFYSRNNEKNDLLTGILCIFEYVPEWHYEHKTSCTQDAIIAKKAGKYLSKAAVLLAEYPDVRWDIQNCFERHIGQVVDMKCVREKMIGRDGKPATHPFIIDFAHILHLLSTRLTEIEQQAIKRKPCVKKIHGEDAFVFYAARRLKELFEKHSVNRRKHVKYITDLINVVMKESTSEERIRKLVS